MKKYTPQVQAYIALTSPTTVVDIRQATRHRPPTQYIVLRVPRDGSAGTVAFGTWSTRRAASAVIARENRACHLDNTKYMYAVIRLLVDNPVEVVK